MPSIVDVCNMALDECKARASITSVFPSDGTLAANVAARHFWTQIDALARSANWNSHRFQAPLAVLKAAQGTAENPDGTTIALPPAPWVYEYAVPTSPLYLKARFIVPLASTAAQSLIPMTTVGNSAAVARISNDRIPYLVSSDMDARQNQMRVILTNQPDAQLVYICRVTDPSLWDSQFLVAAVGVLASYFALPVSGDKAITAGAIARAKDAIVAARVSDGNENPTRTDRIASWHAARGVAGRGAYSPAEVGWEAMSFGDGTVLS